MVNLRKGETVSLAKSDGPQLEDVVMGLGWDVRRPTGFFQKLLGTGSQGIDLDASCVMFGRDKAMLGAVWFVELQGAGGSIIHTGDNRTGAGDGDDEQIRVRLSAVPANIMHLLFTVNSFSGENFSQIENAYCRLVDARTQTEIARYNLSAGGDHTGQVMARLTRSESSWTMTAIGISASGRTFAQMLPSLTAALP